MPTLLIVDDDPVLRRSLCAFLARRGYRVTEAASFAEAHERAADRAFDAVLLDVYLPDGCGLDLLDDVGRERTVVMSGQADDATYAEVGVLHRLDKPLDLRRAAEMLDGLAGLAEAS